MKNMKKWISLIAIFAILTAFVLTVNTYAVSLDTVSLSTDKDIVRPGEEVKVIVNFGKGLGAYILEISYDNNIFEYVSVDGGTANDLGDKIKVVYHDSTGGTNPRENMNVTFKAKADITTSNPTEFMLTAEGLSNADASETYDDITTPLVKNVTVEPEYKDYIIKLEYSGEIIKNEEKEMLLSYSSEMGRYYEHARLIAEAKTPDGAMVKLVGFDEDTQVEQDIIQSGWGDPQGYKIGGKDVSQVLKLQATFTDIGDYAITLKLIDRDNSDDVIAENTFNFTIVETQTEQPTQPENPTEQPTEPEQPQVPSETENITTEQPTTNEQMPNVLPKTGINRYVPILIILIAIVSTCIYYNRKK